MRLPYLGIVGGRGQHCKPGTGKGFLSVFEKKTRKESVKKQIHTTGI